MSNVGRNDPCPCGSGRKYKHCHLGRPDDPAARVVEPPLDELEYGLPNNFVSERQDVADDFDDVEETPRDVAWAVVEEALSATKMKLQAELAAEALEIDPTNPGALFLVGAIEHRNDRAITYFDRAIDEAQRTIAPATLDLTGSGDWLVEEVEFAFYALIHRAIRELRNDLTDSAISTLELVLAYDPLDRLCARSLLALLLVKRNRQDQAGHILTLGDAMTSDINLEWTRVLLSYRQRGDNPFGRRALYNAQLEYPESAQLLLKYVRTNEAAKHDDFRLERLIRANTREMQTEPDVITDDIYLATLAELVRAWRRTPGAMEWLKRMVATGPRILHDNCRFGDGPRLVLVASQHVADGECPACTMETKSQELVLIVEFDNGTFVAVPATVNVCAACDSQILDPLPLEMTIATDWPAFAENDYITIGFVPPEVTVPEPIYEAWLAENLQPWGSIEAVPSGFQDWPTQEEMAAIYDELDRLDLVAGDSDDALDEDEDEDEDEEF